MADSYQMFINGEWVNSSDGGTRDVINPATGEVMASVQEGTAEDANRAVDAAKKAFVTWYDSTPKDRQLALLKLADRIEEHGEEIIKLEAENVGKPYAVTMSEELPPIVDNLRFFGGAARTHEGRSAGEYMAGYTSFVRREPIGVAGLVAPWNYPADDVGLEDRTGARHRQLRRPQAVRAHAAHGAQDGRAGRGSVPPWRVQRRSPGDGEPVGDALVRHPDVGIVSLTGDVNTGKLIAKNAVRLAEARAPGAGRQGARHHLRRRRHLHRRRMGEDRRVLQRRTGLHRGVPRARRFGAVRQRACPSSCRPSSRSRWATRSTTPRRSAPSSRRSSSSASRGSSSARRRPAARSSPVARRWSATASSTSRRSSPT